MLGRELYGRALFRHSSQISHACAPNCFSFSDWDEAAKKFTRVVRSIRSIAAGEELTVSYLSEGILLQPRAQRQAELRHNFGFTCLCSRCSATLTEGSRRLLG